MPEPRRPGSEGATEHRPGWHPVEPSRQPRSAGHATVVAGETAPCVAERGSGSAHGSAGP